MDFRFSPEDEAFRQEVRSFIRKEWDPKDFNNDLGVFGYDFDSAEYRAHSHEFTKKLIAKGWYTMHWPKEWGGQAVPLTKQVVYSEELAYAGAPQGAPGGNITGAIMYHASDEVKRQFLPKMANAEIDWAQGFSEPNAGTDLANLSTRAVEDGDDFVVTGQKIWSSGSHFANWYHVLVRTDPTAPKHRGITYLIMQLKDDKGDQMPNITLRPLYDMFGRRRWNEVFMDEVRVPKRNIIGEVNRGWYAAMTTLNFERAGGTGARNIAVLENFIAIARKLRFNGEPVLNDPLVRHKLADVRVRLETGRMLALRLIWLQSKGEVPQAESAISNYYGSTMNKFHFWPTLAQIMGPYRALLKGEKRSPDNGVYGTNYALSMVTGYAGGGGILLSPNLIAQRGLGLPR
jgi:alkylation response protein AidB-like acyl-CoA dehydrogenase